MNFAEQLKYIMEVECLSIKDVAKACGFTETSIGRYLKGDRAPNIRDAKHLFESLGYTLEICKKKSKKSKKSHKDDLRKNGSGCLDPVACRAIKKVDMERERLTRLLDVIFTICEYAGFHVEGRIELKDKRTGKVWK